MLAQISDTGGGAGGGDDGEADGGPAAAAAAQRRRLSVPVAAVIAAHRRLVLGAIIAQGAIDDGTVMPSASNRVAVSSPPIPNSKSTFLQSTK